MNLSYLVFNSQTYIKFNDYQITLTSSFTKHIIYFVLKFLILLYKNHND